MNPGCQLEVRIIALLRKSEANISSWSYVWKVMRRNAWKDVANLQNNSIQQSHKVATRCMDDHQFKEEEIGSVGELSTVCSQTVVKCLYLARIGRPDI